MRSPVRLAAVVVAVAVVGSTPALAASAPTAPGQVTAVVQRDGVRVTWTPSPGADPAVDGYVVTGGPGSCPVSVPATARTAVLPILPGETSLTPQVFAVNELGYSPAGTGEPVVTAGVEASTRYTNVQLLQLSDFHGALDPSSTSIGAAALASAFDADRQVVARTFTVSSGDNIGASPAISNEFAEIPTIEAMNLMGFDVSTFGNHEHDRGISHLRSVIAASGFDWVVSNYNDLKPLSVAGRKTLPYKIIERDGLKIGFVGMNTEQTVEEVFPGRLTFGSTTIEISPWTKKVQQQADAARAAGADIVVALLHQGWSTNFGDEPFGRLIDVTRKLKGVDAVYGGHSHQTYAAVVDGTPVAEVRNAGVEYTRTQLCFDTKTRAVVGSSVDYVTKAALGANAPANPAIAAMLAGYQAQLNAKLDVRFGSVSDVFPRGGTPPVERSGQTPLGDYTTDAIRARYGTDFAYINGGSIRDTFPASTYTPADPTLRRPGNAASGPYDVTLGDALTVFPFGNSLATTQITGANLWAALENGVSGYPTDGRFPQVSGLRFAFDPDRPEGQRIVSVTKADGTPVPRDDTTYTVTTLDYVVSGGDGYGALFSPARSQIRDLLVDVFVDAMKADEAAGRLTTPPAADGRITLVDG